MLCYDLEYSIGSQMALLAYTCCLSVSSDKCVHSPEIRSCLASAAQLITTLAAVFMDIYWVHALQRVMTVFASAVFQLNPDRPMSAKAACNLWQWKGIFSVNGFFRV